MKAVLMIERHTPKDEERNKKRLKHNYEVMGPYWEKLVDEKGINQVGSGAWADNMGYLVNWIEFETMEDFAKLWEDEGWQKLFAQWVKLVDNVRIRLLRPSIKTYEGPEDN